MWKSPVAPIVALLFFFLLPNPGPAAPLLQALTPGVPVSASFSGAGDEARYEVSVSAGEHLTVLLDGSEDLYSSQVYELYVRFGSQPTTADYDVKGVLPNAGQAVEIPSTQAGTYHILVRSSSGMGSYTLVAHTAATFPTLVPGTGQTANLQAKYDVKFYQVNTGAGEHLSVLLDGSEDLYSSQAYDLYIRFGSLPTLASYDDKGDLPNAGQGVEIPNTQAGTYYVMVRSSLGFGSISIVSHTHATFPTLVPGSPLTGSLQARFDVKLFQVNVAAGEHLTVLLDGSEDLYSTQVYDLYVRFGSLPTLADYDVKGVLPNAGQAVEVPVTQAGTYYVMVRSASGFGSFSIVSYTAATFPTLVPGTGQTANLQAKYDVKFFQVSVAAGEHLTVLLDGSEDLYSAQVYDLYLKFGALPTPADYDVKGSLPNAGQGVEIPNTQAGTYYVMVHSASGFGAFSIISHTHATFPTLVPGSPLTGSLQAKYDVKFYQVNIGAGEHLTVLLDGSEDLYSSQVYELYTRFGSLPTLADYDVKGVLPNAGQAVEIPVTQAGTYYVMVRSASGFGSFSIVSYTAATFPTLVPASPLTGNLQARYDLKLFQVNVAAGEHLTILLDGSEDLYSTQVYELYIRFGSLPTPVSYDDKGDLPNAGQGVEIPGTQAGTYYVMVRSAAGSGSFSIVSHTHATFPTVTEATPRTGHLQAKYDVKFYQVEASAGQVLNLFLDGVEDLYASQVYALYVRYGSLPTLTDYDAKRDLPHADQTAQVLNTQAGTYYIMVRSTSGGGDFSLRIVGPRLDLKSFGPQRVSPGQTVDYAVSYSNLTGVVLDDMVLVARLPGDAEYLENSGGGIYWAQRHQVVWKLGDLASLADGQVSVRVRYVWGLPNGQPESLVILAAARNLPHASIDLEAYLGYEPPKLIARRDLSADDIAGVLAGDPQLRDLMDYAQELGFHDFGVATETSASDGSKLLSFWLVRADTEEILTVMRRDESRLIYRFSPNGLSLMDRSGGMSQDAETGIVDMWGSWQQAAAEPNGWAAVADSARGKCMFNCILTKAPGWGISLAADLTPFKWLGTVMTTKTAIDCLQHLQKQDADTAVACVQWLRSVVANVPVLGTLVDMMWDSMLCDSDCRANPSKYYCTEDKKACTRLDVPGSSGPVGWDVVVTNRCVATFYLPIPEYESCAANIEHCVNGQCVPNCENAAAGPSAASAQPAKHSHSASCALGSGSCALPVESPVSVARDPNEKHGPGEVLPGDEISYEIEFENEGDGAAYGVYVEDYLPPEVDDGSLAIQDGGSYDADTRTITWEIGELQAGQTGSVHFDVHLLSTVSGGTHVINTATVFFPSVPEETPTNPVVTLVGAVIAHSQAVETTEGVAAPIHLTGATVNARPLAYRIVDRPLNGALSGTLPDLIYTPGDGYEGPDHFSFVVVDGAVTSAAAEVTILVRSGAETVPPEVVTTFPLNGTRDVPASTTPAAAGTYQPFIRVAFSEPLDRSTVTAATLQVTDWQGRALAGHVEYDGVGNAARFLPTEPLQPGTQYLATVSSNVTDTSGNRMAADYHWWFYTQGDRQGIYLPLTLKLK